ncbi:MAG: hypothetical protein JNG86_21625, partial [Verrucomicrobiaceae bacterium]|nr:hypothetical protein [Verrucomicrobiaceae bacterium]
TLPEGYENEIDLNAAFETYQKILGNLGYTAQDAEEQVILLRKGIDPMPAEKPAP